LTITSAKESSKEQLKKAHNSIDFTSMLAKTSQPKIFEEPISEKIKEEKSMISLQ
jgi:hypothetical protein